jgi:hypothetical protein
LSVSVRGIYATALSKLLLDSGFSISHPSKKIRERLRIDRLTKAIDVLIWDEEDKHGVALLGRRDVLERVLSLLQEALPAVIVHRSRADIGAIYGGIVKSVVGNECRIDLKPGEGIMPRSGEREGDRVLVQVCRPCFNGNLRLSSNIKINGTYLSLIIGGRGVTISRKVRSQFARSRLLKLGASISNKFGVYWKSKSAMAADDELLNEVKLLHAKAEEALNKFKSGENGLLSEGLGAARVKFTSLTKSKLDEEREKVATTVQGHHFYKSLNKNFASLVDYSERLVAAGLNPATISNVLKDFFLEKTLKTGAFLQIEHVKLDGSVLYLPPGKITAISGREIQLRRWMKAGGVYDGLNIKIEEGDYAQTKFELNGWTMRHAYYSKEDKLKGLYISVNTPVELYNGYIRYVDLAVDIVAWPKGEIKVIDEDELEKAYRDRVISRWLYEEAEKHLNEAVSSLSTHERF